MNHGQRFRNGWLVLVGIAIGCAAGGATLRPARAQSQSSSDARWEYRCEGGAGLDADGGRAMNALGAGGWELATVSHAGVYCFKRPLP